MIITALVVIIMIVVIVSFPCVCYLKIEEVVCISNEKACVVKSNEFISLKGDTREKSRGKVPSKTKGKGPQIVSRLRSMNSNSYLACGIMDFKLLFSSRNKFKLRSQKP